MVHVKKAAQTPKNVQVRESSHSPGLIFILPV